MAVMTHELTITLTLTLLLALVLSVLFIPPLRRQVLTRFILVPFKRSLPNMSSTERDALNAGTVWWDGELFSGHPNWQKLLAIPAPCLTPEEARFITEKVDPVCAMVQDWQISTIDLDLPREVWDYIKNNGFLGFIIPKEYGGLGFSAFAHSEIVTRLSTRSSALAVSVMVPNSLGPAELLLHYGTPAQKQHYLPRLARGLDIPAFALTSPWAGSDAAAIPDSAVVCKGLYEGREVLGFCVSWDKRYITLAPVCTVLGLAFRAYDPDHLLGSTIDLGITCALVPHDHQGVQIGRRHMPLNAAFMNGPTDGKDVFIPFEFVIGGDAMIGQGWRMLMECLSVGRAISLPASNVGMAQLTARTVGAYARVRQQFNTPVAQFEGVEEALTRIAARTYLLDATRRLTAQAVDLGEKPAVISAIAKYHVTEIARTVVNDGMDIIGGKGICLGPKNFLGRAYQQIPIGITVEGANILTRSLIIFGQGAVRAHPFIRAEMDAVGLCDPRAALFAFDKALFGHLLHITRNTACALLNGLLSPLQRRLGATPSGVPPSLRAYYRTANRYALAFAVLADFALLIYGSRLKRHEKISARLGDILSQLYLISATLKRAHNEGYQAADIPLIAWAIEEALTRTQDAFRGVINNLPNCFWRCTLRGLLFPWGWRQHTPSDALGSAVADLVSHDTPSRTRLTQNCFIPAAPAAPIPPSDEPVYALEQALAAAQAAQASELHIRRVLKKSPLPAGPLNNVRDWVQLLGRDRASAPAQLSTEGNESSLGANYQERLRHYHYWRDQVIAVDDFAPDFACLSSTHTQG